MIWWVTVAGACWELSVQAACALRCESAPTHSSPPPQKANHFPNIRQLARKDLLARHLARWQRVAAGNPRLASVLACMPSTFVLPSDWPEFEYVFATAGGNDVPMPQVRDQEHVGMRWHVTCACVPSTTVEQRPGRASSESVVIGRLLSLEHG